VTERFRHTPAGMVPDPDGPWMEVSEHLLMAQMVPPVDSTPWKVKCRHLARVIKAQHERYLRLAAELSGGSHGD
jgi:hypothetical protein